MSSPDPQREPAAVWRAAARDLRELYLSLRGEGFEEHEALTIIGHVIAANRPDQ